VDKNDFSFYVEGFDLIMHEKAENLSFQGEEPLDFYHLRFNYEYFVLRLGIQGDFYPLHVLLTMYTKR
jgi:hypothetical protein